MAQVPQDAKMEAQQKEQLAPVKTLDDDNLKPFSKRGKQRSEMVSFCGRSDCTSNDEAVLEEETTDPNCDEAVGTG